MATDVLARVAPRSDAVVVLVGRLAIAAIFVLSGFGKLMAIGGFAQMLAGKGLPAPMVLAVIGACVEFFGGLALALGWRTRWAALVMILFVIVATLISHRFWEIADAGRMLQQIQFMKNLAIVGGLLLLFGRGGGPLSIDRERDIELAAGFTRRTG